MNLEIIRVIDTYLTELGTQSLIDGDKARDQLMDLRLMLMKDIEFPPVPDTIEGIEDVVPNGEIL